MRIIGRTIVVAVSILVFIVCLNWSLEGISSQSDLGVACGFVGLFVLFAGAALAIRRWFPESWKRPKFLTSWFCLTLAFSGCTRVPPGHVGIQVNMYGQDRGVQSYPRVTGMIWYNPITVDILEYPSFVQTANWIKQQEKNEEICFNSKEGMTVCGDISLSYRLDAQKVPEFYVKFRSDDLETFTHGFLRNVARDSFNEEAAKLGVEELYGSMKEQFLAAARKRINDVVGPFGVIMEQLGFMGAPRLPTNVIEAINNKIAATQQAIRIENELRASKAEAEKAVAQAEGQARAVIAKAEGEAKANDLLARSISAPLLEWKRLEVQWGTVNRWNGSVPTVSGQTAVPFFDLRREAK